MIKKVALDGLTTGDYGGSENVVDVSAAADLCAGAIESGDDLAVGPSSGDELDHLGSDVTTVEIRENEDIGAPGNRGVGHAFLLSYDGAEGGVELEFPVDEKLEFEAGSLFPGDLEGFSDFSDRLVAGVGGMGGVAEHRNPRRIVGQVIGDPCSGERDVGELRRGGIGNHPAVGEKEEPIHPEIGIFLVEDEH